MHMILIFAIFSFSISQRIMWYSPSDLGLQHINHMLRPFPLLPTLVTFIFNLSPPFCLIKWRYGRTPNSSSNIWKNSPLSNVLISIIFLSICFRKKSNFMNNSLPLISSSVRDNINFLYFDFLMLILYIISGKQIYL